MQSNEQHSQNHQEQVQLWNLNSATSAKQLVGQLKAENKLLKEDLEELRSEFQNRITSARDTGGTQN